MNNFTMPYKKEREQDEKKTTSLDIWKALPLKYGSSHHNEVILPLFTPHTWKLFNPTSEEVQRYGLMGSGGLTSMDVNDPINTFYFRLQVHSVYNFNRPDGSSGYSQVICPIQMNKYLVDSLCSTGAMCILRRRATSMGCV